MSVSSRSSRTPAHGQPALAADHDLAAAEAGARDTAGLLLARLTVAPTLLATAFLLASFPLLLAGYYRPAPVIALSVIVAAVIVPLGLWRLPGLVPAQPGSGALAGTARRLWAQPGDPEARDRRRTPWWTVASLLVIAVAFFAFQAAYHSQFLIITRDPASYMQFATWIAGHGSLPIPTNSQDFGNDPSLWYQGFAMYQVGNSVIPQFMAGMPMALAVGYWGGGVNGALLLGPLLGAVAIVVFGGLAARLLGARWAPLAALVLAVSLPQMFTSRSTYSEPFAQILLLGGLSLVIDAQRAWPGSLAPGGAGGGLLARVARWDTGRVIGALAGLALGISLLVRIDSPSDMLPLIPYLGLMLVRRERQAVPMIAGLLVGWLWGWVDAVVLSRPYVFQTNKSSTLPMIAVIVFTIIVTAAGVAWLRRRERSGRGLPQLGRHWYLPGWLPRAAVIAPFVVIAAFAARSHVQRNFVKEQYAQLSLHWVYWYLGGPAIVLATIGVAVLSYGCLRGRWPAWALPLMSFAASIVLFLYRPGITPDQPWASRRLVPAVLPGFILFSVWLVAWACARLRQGEVRLFGLEKAAPWLTGKRRGLVASGVAVACALLLVIPTAVTMRGLAFKRTFTGQVAAIYGLCDRIPSDGSVIIVDSPLADRISQVVRGMCDVPVARFHYSGNVYKNPTAPTSQVLAAIKAVESVGRKPVLLAAHASELAPYQSTGVVTKAMTMKSTMDGRSLLAPPTKTAKENMDIWMLEPTR